VVALDDRPAGNQGKEMTTAHEILQAAAGHMNDRAATYDKPAGERSMGAAVRAFEAVTGIHITETQGWLFMAVLKAVRSQQGAYRADSFEDGAAYFALAGEAAAAQPVLQQADAKPDGDGLIPWHGGECPVAGSVRVCVRLRCGHENFSPNLARTFRWDHRGIDGDIVAYKVVG